MRFYKSLSGLLVVILSSTLFLLTDCSSSEVTIEKVSDVRDYSKYDFKNHHPDAKYIGMAECATCHVDKYLTFQHTGKGKSFHKPQKSKIIEDFSKLPVYDKFSNLYYDAYWVDSNMFIREFRLNKSKDTIHNRVEEVGFVIGSGNQTRSYIRVINNYYYEMPITWYVSKGIWDLSPGYENGLNSRFDRPVGDMCLSCHNSNLQYSKNSSNHFTKVGEGIECEKCHGPGSLHMNAVMNEKDYEGTIINPAKISTELRFDICRQCHLEGVVVNKDGKSYTDYRPGMKLGSIYDVFIPVHESDADFGFASHAERLQMSACFKGMNGEMACTTCHDPHKSFDENPVDYFNKQCGKCHGVDACGEDHLKMVAMENDCVKCHMARGGTHDIPHVSSTDHNIRVLEAKESKIKDVGEESKLKVFKNFTSDKVDARTNVLLHMNYYEQFEGNLGYLKRVENQAKYLKDEEKLKFYFLLGKEDVNLELSRYNINEINDPYSSYYLFKLHQRRGDNRLNYLEKSVALAPDNLDFLFELASSYSSIDKEKSVYYYKKILDKYPLHSKALVNYGFYLLQMKQFKEAELLLKKAVFNYPDYQLAKENLLSLYLQTDRIDDGKKLLKILIEKYPENRKYLKLRSRI